MNTAEGKKILSLIRDGDFAHPGEEEAVRMVFAGTTRDENRKVLDIGCGLGGTAQLITNMGLGRVTGVDVDGKTIDYASRRYPGVAFVCADATTLAEHVPAGFELLCMFNSLYTMPDQIESLRQAALVAKASAELVIFDYSGVSGNRATERFIREYNGSRFQPLPIDLLPNWMGKTGWRLESTTDISVHYERWYAAFLGKVASMHDELVQQSSEETYRQVCVKFQKLHQGLKLGAIGGAIVRARRAE